MVRRVVVVRHDGAVPRVVAGILIEYLRLFVPMVLVAFGHDSFLPVLVLIHHCQHHVFRHLLWWGHPELAWILANLQVLRVDPYPVMDVCPHARACRARLTWSQVSRVGGSVILRWTPLWLWCATVSAKVAVPIVFATT